MHPDAPGGACNSLAKPFTSVKPVEIPKCGSVAVRPNPPNTEFRRFYERGDLPIAIEHSGVGNKIQWKVSCPPNPSRWRCRKTEAVCCNFGR